MDGADELPEVMDFDFEASEWEFLLDDPAGRKSPPSSSPTTHTETEDELDVLRGCLIFDSEGSALSSPDQMPAGPGCSAEDCADTPLAEQETQTAQDGEDDKIREERLEAIHQFITAHLSAVRAGTFSEILMCNLQIPVVSGNESTRFSKSADWSPPGTFCIVVESLNTDRDRAFDPANRRVDCTPNPVKWEKKKKGDRWERTVSWRPPKKVRAKDADDDHVYAPPPPACISDRALDKQVSRVQEDEGFRVGRCRASSEAARRPLRADFLYLAQGCGEPQSIADEPIPSFRVASKPK
jgi:hypothetical protein